MYIDSTFDERLDNDTDFMTAIRQDNSGFPANVVDYRRTPAPPESFEPTLLSARTLVAATRNSFGYFFDAENPGQWKKRLTELIILLRGAQFPKSCIDRH